MFFRKKPKPPLHEAIALVDKAAAITRRCWRDRGYRLSDADLALFINLEQRLFRSYGMVRRIVVRMERRFLGEPEVNEDKWFR